MTIKYLSTKGGVSPVDFDEAVLQGFALDGGLFVPDTIPTITKKQFEEWSTLNFTELAFKILSLYIKSDLVSPDHLESIVQKSFASFQSQEKVEIVQLAGFDKTYIVELFHGPTLSFKDMAMGFLLNIMDYFLEKRKNKINIILATTGDTGPAAAWASAGKNNINCWPLFPKGMITREQELQMTTINADNVFPVGVSNCPDGGDDLDLVLAEIFSDNHLREKLNLSSVNSINWCRVMVQSIHYIYSYLKIAKSFDEKIVFSVPSGAFGNLFGGYLARAMGLPVYSFICANNVNNTLHNAFSTGVFQKKDLIETKSSAIDIVVPYNFWRYLYFMIKKDAIKLNSLFDNFSKYGKIKFDDDIYQKIKDGFLSCSITDIDTIQTIKEVFSKSKYLLDPHTAVAVKSIDYLRNQLDVDSKILCLATAHPAKFPDIIKESLGSDVLPQQATHKSLNDSYLKKEKCDLCHLNELKTHLIESIKNT